MVEKYHALILTLVLFGFGSSSMQTGAGNGNHIHADAIDECLIAAGVNRSSIVLRSHLSYASLNYQWNKYGDPIQPLGYLLPDSVPDIQKAVICGRALGVRVVPRNGGHSFAKYSFGDNSSLVLDLQKLDEVSIDPAAGTCNVGAGARIGFLAWSLWTRARKVLPLGSYPGVGVSSALGGGDGALARLHGLTLDNILEMDIVDVNGQLLTATANHDTNSDLFWALRGAGGGSLGIVTRFKFRIHDPPSAVVYGLRWYDLDSFPEVFHRWQNLFMGTEAANTLNSGLHISGTTLFLRLYEIRSDPNHVPIEESLVSKIFATLPPTNESSIQLLSYPEFLLKSTLFGFEQLPEEAYEFPTDFRSTYYKVKSFYVNLTLENGSREAELIYGELKRIPDTATAVVKVDFFAAGGRVNEIGVSDTAYVHRGRNGYSVHIVYDGEASEVPEVSTKGGRMEEALIWMRNFYALTRVLLRHTESYQNYVDEDLGDDDDYLQRYYGSNLDLLVAIKRKYDPDNYFWTPQSIPPSLPSPNGSQSQGRSWNYWKSSPLAMILATRAHYLIE